MSLPPVDPQRLYPFSEACRYIPCPRAGRKTSLKTIHRWCQQGLFQASCQQRGKLRYWFVLGSELMKLCELKTTQPEPAPGPVFLPPGNLYTRRQSPRMRSPEQLRRAGEACMERLRKMGVKV